MATDRSKKTKALADASKKNVMLAHKFNPKIHVIEPTRKVDRVIKNWDIYEKIDGIRAIFKDGQLYSRYGNRFHAPKEFLDSINWKGTTLDGELFHLEGLQKTGSIVRDQTNKNTMEYWSELLYIVFDHIKSGPFESRLSDLSPLEGGTYTKVLYPIGKVRKITNIYSSLSSIEAHGGEGLILRNPLGEYTLGRSWDLLKVKSFDSCEVTIEGYYAGTGKYEGMIGGLECKLDNGIRFQVGTGLSDYERVHPPKIGEKATIKYMGKTDQGVPRHAVFVAVRDYE